MASILTSQRDRVSDLVVDSRIEASWDSSTSQTKHTYGPVGQSSRHQSMRSEEKWQRKQCLGRGAYGVVWLEECISRLEPQGHSAIPTHRLRAVKEIRRCPNLPTSEVHRELEAIAKFSHQRFAHCFVTSYGWYEMDDGLFIAMEYLKYGDLQKYLINPFPESEARQIVVQIVEALDLMHRNGFAHRDIKPSNVLVLKRGPAWSVKLSDFGISKRAEGTAGLTTLDIGTSGFMAPEVFGLICPDFDEIETFQSSKYSFTVDLWAVGEMTHRLLTTKQTFQTPVHRGLYINKVHPFPTAALEAVGASSACILFIQKAMAPSPKMRLTAADALSHTWMRSHELIEEDNARSSTESYMRRSIDDLGDQDATAEWSTMRQTKDRKVAPQVDRISTADNFIKEDVTLKTLPASLPDEKYISNGMLSRGLKVPTELCSKPRPKPQLRHVYFLRQPQSHAMLGADLLYMEEARVRAETSADLQYLYVNFSSSFLAMDTAVTSVQEVAEQTARQMGLATYTFGQEVDGDFDYWKASYLVRNAAHVLLIYAGKHTEVASIQPENISQYVQPLARDLRTKFLLLSSLRRETISIHFGRKDNDRIVAFEGPSLQISPGRLLSSFEGVARSMNRLALKSRAASSMSHFDQVVGFMEELADQKWPSRLYSEVLAAFCPRSTPQSTNDTDFEAFIRALLANDHLKFVERWLCSVGQGSKQRPPLMLKADKWHPYQNVIVPLFSVSGIGHRESIVIRGAKSCRLHRGALGIRRIMNTLVSENRGFESRLWIFRQHLDTKAIHLGGSGVKGKDLEVNTLMDTPKDSSGKDETAWTLVDVQAKSVTYFHAWREPSHAILLGTEPEATRVMLCSNEHLPTSTSNSDGGSGAAQVGFTTVFYRECVLRLDSDVEQGFHPLHEVNLAPRSQFNVDEI